MGEIVGMDGQRSPSGVESIFRKKPKTAKELEKQYDTAMNLMSDLMDLEFITHREGLPEATACIRAARLCILDNLEEIVKSIKK